MSNPTTWSEVDENATGWYAETPEFAYYNTGRPYNADVPYDVDIAVKATEWDALTAIATQWSEI